LSKTCRFDRIIDFSWIAPGFSGWFPGKGRMHFGEFNPRDTIFARTKAFDLNCRPWRVVRCAC